MGGKADGRSSRKHRRRLAVALRGLCIELVRGEAPDEVFLEAAEAVEAYVERLKGEPRRERRMGGSLEEEIRQDDGGYHYGDLRDFSPVAGAANPVAPPVRLYKEGDDALVGKVVFSAAYEGGPGVVHGGFVAAAFDELLGLTQSLTGRAGMTAKLKVRYRSPCPLERELRMKGRVYKTEGRMIVARGTMHAGERLVADGEATFIVLDPETYREKVSRVREE